MLYGADGDWWQFYNGAKKFGGVKICQDPNTCARYRDINLVKVKDKDRIFVDEAGVIGNGGNSGFQAINLAIQFGIKRIILVGYDMHGTQGVHWHGVHPQQLNNPLNDNFVKWRQHHNNCAAFIASLGVEVVNVSSATALMAYPIMTMEQALDNWGLHGRRSDQDIRRLSGEQRGPGEPSSLSLVAAEA